MIYFSAPRLLFHFPFLGFVIFYVSYFQDQTLNIDRDYERIDDEGDRLDHP